jgi:hypothetical protein
MGTTCINMDEKCDDKWQPYRCALHAVDVRDKKYATIIAFVICICSCWIKCCNVRSKCSQSYDSFSSTQL